MRCGRSREGARESERRKIKGRDRKNAKRMQAEETGMHKNVKTGRRDRMNEDVELQERWRECVKINSKSQMS